MTANTDDLDDRDSDYCSECKGSGYFVDAQGDHQDCPKCYGSGYPDVTVGPDDEPANADQWERAVAVARKLGVKEPGPDECGYIWLDEYERGGAAECGCWMMQDSDGPRVFLCDMHSNARVLLDAVKALLSHTTSHSDCHHCHLAREALRKAGAP